MDLGTEQVTLWFQLRGHQTDFVCISATTCIARLKEAIHTKCSKRLKHIDSGELLIFLHKGDAEASLACSMTAQSAC
jgi:hypothetical protein